MSRACFQRRALPGPTDRPCFRSKTDREREGEAESIKGRKSPLRASIASHRSASHTHPRHPKQHNASLCWQFHLVNSLHCTVDVFGLLILRRRTVQHTCSSRQVFATLVYLVYWVYCSKGKPARGKPGGCSPSFDVIILGSVAGFGRGGVWW